MFYKQFSVITDILNPDFVENFDYWLATLPQRSKKNITASVVSAIGSKLFLSGIDSEICRKEKDSGNTLYRKMSRL